MRKVNITVGQCLAVLLCLPALAASETSKISLFPRLAPVESVAVFPIAADGVSTALSGDFVHYRKEHIELREIFYAPFALLCLEIFAPCANFPVARGYPENGICSRQDAKHALSGVEGNAKSGSLISLRPLRLCGRYSEFWLRLCRAAFSVVDSSPSGTGGASPAAADHQQSAAVRRFERSLARVQPLLQRYGYGAAFVAVMAEGMGIPTPGQTLLMAGALEAAEGRMSIALLLILVTTAATLGNSVGYAIGRWGGRAALDKLKVNPQRQQHLDDLFKRHGGVVILLARFLDGLRQLNGIVAGVLQMPWWTFTAYNVAGALLWTCSWGLGTYYLGRDIHFIAAFFHRHRPLLLVLGATAFVALLVYLLRSRNPRPTRT
jgi:membrane protein DedA with SNARE-associated domain